MINIAIVEDEKVASDLIYDYLLNYGKKSGEEFNVTVFKDPLALLENYKPTYDLIFTDIMMPNMDGMQASHKLRELDSSVLLIFITNMGDYAVKGYDVGASAFIKKPVSYFDFEQKMNRAIYTIKSRDDKVLIISSGTTKFRILLRDLMYIEVSGHKCIYHTSSGIIEGRNTLSSLSKQLEIYDFMLCNSCFLINPTFIKNISGYTVKVGDDILEISRSKKKNFMMQFNNWIAKGGSI